MSDTKTEWRAESYFFVPDNKTRWRVSMERPALCMGLDRATAHSIAAVNELEAALLGPDGDNPQLTRVAWLDTLLGEIEEGTFGRIGEDEDPDATAEMLQILRDLVVEGSAALAKARGEK